MKRSSSYRPRRKSKLSFIKTFFKTVLILASLAIAVILLTPSPYFKDGFKNLTELQTYAAQTNEQTPMENADTLRPEFTKYYQSQIPTFSQKIKNKIKLLLYLAGIKEKPVWSVSFFKTILENTEKSRKNSGQTDNLIYKIQTEPNSKFVIFGNMQGAFHSLVRCLDKIKELGIIGSDLKITNPNYYIIFMGDLIDRSPFTLEILTAGLKLMEVNPQNVIYMRGNHEAKDYWQEHTLKTELQIRAAHLSKEAIPLQKEVSSFFNTLPLAIYLTVPKPVGQPDESDFIRISEFARSENNILNESVYADFLTKRQSPGISYFVIKEANESASAAVTDTPVNIKATIHNEKKRKTFQKSEGLRLLAPDMDSVSWTILSCPTIVYQKALDFYNDAFVILSAADSLENWEITLYSHDVRTKDPFKETKFNFLSGLDINSHKTKMATVQLATKHAVPQQAQIAPQQTQAIQLPQTATQTQPQANTVAPQVIVPTQQQQTQASTATPQNITPSSQQSHPTAAPAAPQVIAPIQQQPTQTAPQVQQPMAQQSQTVKASVEQPTAQQTQTHIPKSEQQAVAPITQLPAQTQSVQAPQAQQAPQVIIPTEQNTQAGTQTPQVITPPQPVVQTQDAQPQNNSQTQ